MCGIVGYVGLPKKSSYLISKLKLLEYRGYDSAGYANLLRGNIEIIKEVGSIDNLEAEHQETNINCAIAHTRWATHGKVTQTNSHPHSSINNSWTIVHNGIIENYEQLSSILKFSPVSDTDTAVVAQFLEEEKVDDIFGFIDAFSKLKGSFAVCAINKDQEDTLYLAKRKSPLFVSQNKSGETLVASDPICFKDFSKLYYMFEDDEFAIVKNKKIIFYNKNAKIIKKQLINAEKFFDNYGKNGYSSFMLKEIFEESDALKSQVNYYKDQDLFKNLDLKFLNKFNKIKLIGCGTAYNASVIGARYFQKLLGKNAEADFASEFIYNTPVFADKKTLFIFVSQSGETADTLMALELAKKKGSTCIALTNVIYSSLAKKADIVLPVCAGVEVAVASTKAYVCQLSALYILASHFANLMHNKNIDFYGDILSVSKKILSFDKENLNSLANIFKDIKECIFIGKDMDYVSAQEAALKLKETTYICASSHPSGELKHGYLALIEEDTPIIAFAGQSELLIKTKNSVKEAVSRGAFPIIFTNSSDMPEEFKTIYIDEKNELLMPMLSIAPLQYMACKISELKNINPDKPRNLAKSVTVE